MLAQNDEAAHQAALSMYMLSGDEKIRKQCEARERYELDRIALIETGLSKGLEQGAKEQQAKNVHNMLNKKASYEQISDFLDIPIDEIKRIEKEMLANQSK